MIAELVELVMKQLTPKPAVPVPDPAPMPQVDPDALFNRLGREEAFRLKPYDDKTGKELVPGDTLQGNVTIAIGVNLTAGLTAAEAIFLTQGRIRAAELDLMRNIPWVGRLDPIRQQVLVDMCFNMGWPILSGFHNTLKAVEEGRYADAAAGMRASKWFTDVGQRAVRLSAAMETGAFPA
jgi:lysozyme